VLARSARPARQNSRRRSSFRRWFWALTWSRIAALVQPARRGLISVTWARPTPTTGTCFRFHSRGRLHAAGEPAWPKKPRARLLARDENVPRSHPRPFANSGWPRLFVPTALPISGLSSIWSKALLITRPAPRRLGQSAANPEVRRTLLARERAVCSSAGPLSTTGRISGNSCPPSGNRETGPAPILRRRCALNGPEPREKSCNGRLAPSQQKRSNGSSPRGGVGRTRARLSFWPAFPPRRRGRQQTNRAFLQEKRSCPARESTATSGTWSATVHWSKSTTPPNYPRPRIRRWPTEAGPP